MPAISICFRGVFPRTTKFLQTVFDEFGVDFTCSKRTDFIVIPDDESIEDVRTKPSIRELLTRNKQATVVTLGEFVYSATFTEAQRALILAKIPVTRPPVSEEYDTQSSSGEEDGDDEDVDASVTPKPTRLSFAAHDQVRLFDKTKPIATNKTKIKPVKATKASSVVVDPQPTLVDSDIQFHLSMEVGGATSALPRKTVVKQCEAVVQVRARDLALLLQDTSVNAGTGAEIIMTSMHLFIFGTSLDHTGASDNRAISFFQQHFPTVLAPFLYSGAFTVARAVRLAYDTTQARFWSEVEASMPEDEVALASLSVILVDDVDTGAMLVFSFGNNRMFEYGSSDGGVKQPYFAAVPEPRMSQESSNNNNDSIVLTAIPTQFPGWPGYSAYVDTSDANGLSVASTAAFGSSHWIHAMQQTLQHRQHARDVLRTSAVASCALGIQPAAFTEVAEPVIIRSPQSGKSEVLICNHAFALGALEPGTDHLTVEIAQMLKRNGVTTMERKQLSDLAQASYTNLSMRSRTRKQLLPAELANPVVMRITVATTRR